MNAGQRTELLATLQQRFERNMSRHPGMNWSDVVARIEAFPEKLQALFEMEKSGGEPDVVGRDEASGELICVDCAAESPAGRRSLCYDQEALDARKENKPAGCATAMAAAMGVDLLTEQQYRDLQELGSFDLKTSSWIQTPAALRKLGGALFCDRRYDRVFVYHNGAQSYYAARGFRAVLKI
ncbi:MAG: DUF4256 domain-containing protein [Rhodocyclaceae bacterium]|nr:DUF4256 domain-containing protein [Rhodocyclaceae bacterium]